jgi:hypothetical protein
MENPHNFTDTEWLILCNRINAFGYRAPITRIMGKLKYQIWKAYHPEIDAPSWMKPVEQG